MEDVTYGDIGLALPYRIVTDIFEGLQRLNRIMPGVNNDDTLIYAPEAKFHALRIKNSDGYLQTSIPGIYVAGDGAGLSRELWALPRAGFLLQRVYCAKIDSNLIFLLNNLKIE